MVENLGEWPSNRRSLTNIRPSDGCGRDAVPLAVERRYDFPESGGYLGNVGLICINDSWDNSCLAFKSTTANILSGADRMRLLMFMATLAAAQVAASFGNLEVSLTNSLGGSEDAVAKSKRLHLRT